MDGWTFPFVSFIIISRMLKNRGKSGMNETILLIEDNESIIMGLEYLLTEEQYTFLAAKTKKEAQDLLASRQVDLVLLDVSLPDGNGFDLCRKIKEHDIAPVIFLTAKDEEKDVVLGFDLGADDYVTKPFSPRELMVRIKALLKRSGVATTDNKLDVCGMHLNAEEREITIDDEIINLTQKEFEVLIYFINHHKLVLSREQILDRVWGYDYEGDIRVVDTTIKRLRKKMNEKGECIQTVRGLGYKFKE